MIKPVPIVRTPGALVARPSAIGAVPRKPLAAYQVAPDPLTPPPDGADPQEIADQEIGELAKGFRERMADEAARFKSATDAKYYFVAAFEDGAQCDAFLAACGIAPGQADLFIDGRKLAEGLKIALPKCERPPTYTAKVDKKLAALVRRPAPLP